MMTTISWAKPTQQEARRGEVDARTPNAVNPDPLETILTFGEGQDTYLLLLSAKHRFVCKLNRKNKGVICIIGYLLYLLSC